MATFTNATTHESVDIAVLSDNDLWSLQAMVDWEINRRSVISNSPAKLKALFEEYEAAGGDRGLLVDRVDPAIRNPSGAVHSDIEGPM